MHLRLLGAVLYYLGPTGWQGTLELWPFLPSKTTRNNDATCYMTVSMGINAMDVRVSPDFGFGDTTAKFARDEEILCVGCGTEQTVPTTVVSHKCQTCRVRTRPAAVVAHSGEVPTSQR